MFFKLTMDSGIFTAAVFSEHVGYNVKSIAAYNFRTVEIKRYNQGVTTLKKCYKFKKKKHTKLRLYM